MKEYEEYEYQEDEIKDNTPLRIIPVVTRTFPSYEKSIRFQIQAFKKCWFKSKWVSVNGLEFASLELAKKYLKELVKRNENIIKRELLIQNQLKKSKIYYTNLNKYKK
jgi:hypothetical protein